MDEKINELDKFNEFLPAFYTENQEGVFITWDTDLTININNLYTLSDEEILYSKSDLYILVNQPNSFITIKVHSILFAPINLIHGYASKTFARWDCINGWTKTIEAANDLFSKIK